MSELDVPQLLRIAADLETAMEAGVKEPDADGVTRWSIGGREWTARPYVGPGAVASHGVQTPKLPGFYVCAANHAHANLKELCELVGLEHNAENELLIAGLVSEAGHEADLKMHITGKGRL